MAVKIEGPNQPLYGRQLEEKDTLYSLISRQSIDTLKEFYRSDVSNDEWALIVKLKKEFDVMWGGPAVWTRWVLVGVPC